MRILFRKKIFREGKYNSEEEKENEREIGRRVPQQTLMLTRN